MTSPGMFFVSSSKISMNVPVGCDFDEMRCGVVQWCTTVQWYNGTSRVVVGVVVRGVGWCLVSKRQVRWEAQRDGTETTHTHYTHYRMGL